MGNELCLACLIWGLSNVFERGKNIHLRGWFSEIPSQVGEMVFFSQVAPRQVPESIIIIVWHLWLGFSQEPGTKIHVHQVWELNQFGKVKQSPEHRSSDVV